MLMPKGDQHDQQRIEPDLLGKRHPFRVRAVRGRLAEDEGASDRVHDAEQRREGHQEGGDRAMIGHLGPLDARSGRLVR
jgi:hypothetical protein